MIHLFRYGKKFIIWLSKSNLNSFNRCLTNRIWIYLNPIWHIHKDLYTHIYIYTYIFITIYYLLKFWGQLFTQPITFYCSLSRFFHFFKYISILNTTLALPHFFLFLICICILPISNSLSKSTTTYIYILPSY